MEAQTDLKKTEAHASRRILALDAVRGIAALVVLVHHSMLTDPSLANHYRALGQSLHADTYSWWLTFTPLHLLWDGTEAVFLFFVLSGFVLTLPLVRTKRTLSEWIAYYPRRLLRLYLPVWAAVGTALAIAILVPRRAVVGASWWINAHAVLYSSRSVLRDAVLVTGTDWLNSVLWSLRWEVLFSLALPAFALLFSSRRWTLPRASLVLASLLVGALGMLKGWPHCTWFFYFATFACGAMIATHWDRLRAIGESIGPGVGVAAVVLGLLLMNTYWTVAAFAGSGRGALGLARFAEVVGATILVVVVGCWPGIRRTLEGSVFQWLGERSYSLYLVHEPIVVSIGLLSPARGNPWVTLGFALPISLFAAEAFFRLVERPSQAWARTLGRKRASSMSILARSGADKADKRNAA